MTWKCITKESFVNGRVAVLYITVLCDFVKRALFYKSLVPLMYVVDERTPDVWESPFQHVDM